MCVALLATNVQLLISKNQQQIPHSNIQIVHIGKLDTLCSSIPGVPVYEVDISLSFDSISHSFLFLS
jgi:hypothetical protein